MTEKQHWIYDRFEFLKTHIRRKDLSKSSGFKSPQRGVSASAASTLSFHKVQQIQTVGRLASALTQHISHPFPALSVSV